jgi:chaperone LolA
MKKKNILLSLIAAFAAFQLRAAEVDLVAAALAGKEARFSQSFTPKGFRNAQVESGTVLFGPMPKMRWTYDRPESKLFVFDGSMSWFYVPADRQVTVARLTDARRREMPFLLIGDAAARQAAFSIREKKRGASVVTTLQPRAAGGMIRSVTLVTKAAEHTIESIEYTDREGNRTRFDLSGYHSAAAPAYAFRFTPPPGVQVANGD